MPAPRLPLFCALVLPLLAIAAVAAVYGPARSSIAASPDCQWLLKVVPGSFGSDLAADGSRLPAQAIVYRFDVTENAFVQAATSPLRNKHAPKTAMISNGGEFIVTLDDWEPEVGRTGNAVVVCGGNGQFVRSWALEDFLTPEDLRKANRPIINSLGRYWNDGHPNFAGHPTDRVLLIYPPERRLVGVRYVLDLRSLKFTPQPWRRSAPEEVSEKELPKF